MAITLHLICLDCHESLWVGQRPQGEKDNAGIYTIPAEAAKQGRFYMKHLGHRLVAQEEYGLERIEQQNGKTIAEFEPD